MLELWVFLACFCGVPLPSVWGTMSNLTIRQAYEDISAAESALKNAVKSVLPVDALVFWDRRGKRQFGCINRHVGDRVEVTNTLTDKTYLLHAFWFTEEHGGGVY